MRPFPILLLPVLLLAFAVSAFSQTAASIQNIRRAGTAVELTFTGSPDTTYLVESSPSLDTGTWTTTGVSANGTGALQTLTIPAAGTAARRFFRLSGTPVAIPGFVFIPRGSFQMGDQSPSPYDGQSSERPVITLELPGFYLKTTEVTKAEWDTVRTYADTHGYTFTSTAGAGKAPNHPAHSMNWYDAVKWCNAWSEKDGLEPCYYLNSGLDIYRSGSPSAILWNFSKNGYRLPAEAEWEKAARAGLTAQRFPWGTTISHTRANYRATLAQAYDTASPAGFHPAYNDGIAPYTAPVASFPANAPGLYDMSGNLREFCWDSSIRSDYSQGYTIRPTSSTSSFPRIARGGDWSSDAATCRCSYRSTFFPDTGKGNYLGFRPARGRIN